MISAIGQADKLLSITTAQPCFRLSLADIQSATKDFDDELVIGQGGFGKVYKGNITIEETSHVVAIKRLDSKSNQGAPEFRTEIEMLSKLCHCHLVSLIGFCDDNNEMILIYVYMPHGTLYHHLHKAETRLSWVQRLKIAIGAGRGLDYLHTGVGTHEGVIHRDVKSSNILLDENWEAMISDFGLSKIGPTNQSSPYVDVSASVKGTFGYLDPEYFYTRKLTRKTDVYAFGVLLFELLSGRHAVDERNGVDHCSLVRWGQRCVKERKLDQMVDSSISGTISPKCLRGFAQIANRCVHGIPKERPSMTEIVASLQALLELQKKSDDSAESSSVTGLTWKIHKYLVFTTKQNSDKSGTSSSKSLENNLIHNEMPHQHGKFMATLKTFTYADLTLATRHFRGATFLGDGTYAKVYKGWVNKETYFPSKKNDGLPIAVKKLHRYRQSKTISKLDLEILEEFNHPNLVKLIGYCLEDRKRFLVYEFMNNSNFEHHLHSGAIGRLPLATKVKIAVGIARGFAFLHTTQNQVGADSYEMVPVSESRLDRHKILLDEDFTAKLSGYDVIKLVHGGYPQITRYDYPEVGCYYPGYGPCQLRSNLWGFTVVFAEVLTGKEIYTDDEFQEIDILLQGKMSLVDIAFICFRRCNEVDSELKMLKMLEQYIPACQDEEFTTKIFESSLSSSNCLEHRTMKRRTSSSGDLFGSMHAKAHTILRRTASF